LQLIFLFIFINQAQVYTVHIPADVRKHQYIFYVLLTVHLSVDLLQLPT